MFIAIDDTDSPGNMCTTFVLTEIIRKSGFDVIGLPRLVRLNPTIPFKTRGNASLCVNLGRGTGKPKKIGRILGNDIFSFDSGEECVGGSSLLDLAEDVVLEYAELDEENTNPGIVVSERPFEQDFYWKTVRDISTIEDAEQFIRSNDGQFRKIKNGRGIIGSAAAISWPRLSRTYELLFYDENLHRSIPRDLKFALSGKMDAISGTFNNMDLKNRHPAIFPDQSTPVIMGIRSVKKEGFLENVLNVPEVSEIHASRYMLYETNQGTDDHIITDARIVEDYHSYKIDGFMSSRPLPIAGSHYFAEMNAGERKIKVAAFEPTKEFRKIFSQLYPLDLVSVYGSVKNETLNVEKMEVKSLAKVFERSPPECPICHVMALNNGIGDYRCPNCGSRLREPHYKEMERGIRPGRYDVPVSARRHLSRPFSIIPDTEAARERT